MRRIVLFHTVHYMFSGKEQGYRKKVYIFPSFLIQNIHTLYTVIIPYIFTIFILFEFVYK